jgi:hypothetical protein
MHDTRPPRYLTAAHGQLPGQVNAVTTHRYVALQAGGRGFESPYLARDYERDPATSEAMIRWAAINTMTSRIARGEPATRQQRWHRPGES